MQAVIRRASVKSCSLICVAVLSQAAFSFGGVVPLPSTGESAIGSSKVPSEQPKSRTPDVFANLEVAPVVAPVIEIAPTRNQASAPAPVPLPPAMQTGLSGGATLAIAAGLRKLRRIIRRGF